MLCMEVAMKSSNQVLLVVVAFLWIGNAVGGTEIDLVKDGAKPMSIIVGSVKEPAAELQRYLERISGAKFPISAAKTDATGIHVGLAGDFPWIPVKDTDRLGPEGFILRSDGKNLYIIGKEPAGVQHGVTTLLQAIGCRWFFPGKAWEVVPERKTISGSWDTRQTPDFPRQRKIWYGFGASASCAADLKEWERHNRMGVPNPVTIGHSWHGLDPKIDFEKHPTWFAEVKGKRQPSKPCYSHPEVIERAIQHSLAQAAKGARMISMTPPDGLGFCECERCMAVCRGGKPYQQFGTTFARRPDGVLVNVTSETLFAFINKVAEAVAAKYPDTTVGCYAYSAYSHPPSFQLKPNVFLQATTAYRRTPLTLSEQLTAFEKAGVEAGIRGYFSVYQWDWDGPVINKGELMLPRLVDDLRFYKKQNVRSINAEASNNWAPRGLGYYVAGQLMWDVRTDPKALIGDFYDKAFGPAALPMERYYTRWCGPAVAVRTKPATAKGVPVDKDKKVGDELEIVAAEKLDVETLKAAYRDLEEAARLVKNLPDHRTRVDHLRMYAHYLFLRVRLEQVGRKGNKEDIRNAVREETVFGARLMNTNMIHARPLIGKEFFRHFQRYKDALEGTPEWPKSDRDTVQKAAGRGYRQARNDIPGHEEIERLWAADKKEMGLP
jgi:hypothetical protein